MFSCDINWSNRDSVQSTKVVFQSLSFETIYIAKENSDEIRHFLHLLTNRSQQLDQMKSLTVLTHCK